MVGGLPCSSAMFIEGPSHGARDELTKSSCLRHGTFVLSQVVLGPLGDPKDSELTPLTKCTAVYLAEDSG